VRTSDDLRYHYLDETSTKEDNKPSKSQKSQVNLILKEKEHRMIKFIGKNNFSPIVWMNFQTGSDYPIEV
jgi:hypothetical protein